MHGHMNVKFAETCRSPQRNTSTAITFKWICWPLIQFMHRNVLQSLALLYVITLQILHMWKVWSFPPKRHRRAFTSGRSWFQASVHPKVVELVQSNSTTQTYTELRSLPATSLPVHYPLMESIIKWTQRNSKSPPHNGCFWSSKHRDLPEN